MACVDISFLLCFGGRLVLRGYSGDLDWRELHIETVTSLEADEALATAFFAVTEHDLCFLTGARNSFHFGHKGMNALFDDLVDDCPRSHHYHLVALYFSKPPHNVSGIRKRPTLNNEVVVWIESVKLPYL
jgi:hypothetical protein